MKVFFSQKMVADSESYSPSAGKPALVVADWKLKKFDIEVVAPNPASPEQFYRAHKASHVDGILAGRIANGFGNQSMAVADSLRYTTGSMIDAVHCAYQSKENTCAPVSGFHHAGWNHVSGFCTLNGLMVAALDLLETTDAELVGILDLDQHYGDGTDNILNKLDAENSIIHFSGGKKHRTVHDAYVFLANLPDLIRDLYSNCDVLIYQAGADPHVDDPLGGWMTTEQLKERDRIVFATAQEINVPVAWNLAGGYQRDEDGGISKVLQIHANTMDVCIQTQVGV